MTDVGLMIKAMRLAWIPRLLKNVNSNWNIEPNFFLKKTRWLKLPTAL